MKRREFIQTSAFTAVGLLSMPSFLTAAKTQNNVGLQLYTLRSVIGTDPRGVTAKVASFGYKELETYGYADGQIFGMSFREFAAHVKGLGMKITSGHYPLDMASSDKWKAAVEDAKAIGQKYMVVPWINEEQRKTIDDYKRTCDKLNKAGEICSSYGMRFGYHNHAFEFDKVEDQIPYDVMLAELDPKNVGMEMDLYWVYRAGYDPVKYFEKYPGRFEQWHVKDMDKNDRDRNADVGTGTIDFKTLFACAKKSGMKHFYIEQETYPGEPIDSVSASIKNLKAIL